MHITRQYCYLPVPWGAKRVGGVIYPQHQDIKGRIKLLCVDPDSSFVPGP